jgi:hypothetical protein
MKLKFIAAAAALVVAGAVNAQALNFASGNSDLFVNFVTTGASNTAGTSGIFNLGMDMNTFIAQAQGVAGYTHTWNLNDIGYGTAWSTLTTAGATSGLSFNVIAGDTVNSRMMSTAGVTPGVFAGGNLVNSNLNGMGTAMDPYVTANQTRGTMATGVGAATAVAGAGSNIYFKTINGQGDGATWAAKTSQNTVAAVGTAENFWLLSLGAGAGSAQTVKTAIGYDVNGNGSIGAGEYGQWTVNQAAGTITFTNPVPEPETFAMLLAGLGLMGAIVRRRKTAA